MYTYSAGQRGPSDWAAPACRRTAPERIGAAELAWQSVLAPLLAPAQALLNAQPQPLASPATAVDAW